MAADTIAVLSKEITQERINAYASVAGDFNPIHVNPEYAAKTAFGSTIAHGFLIFGLGSVLLQNLYGHRWAGGGTIDVKFRKPARPGDVINVRAKKAGLVEIDGISREKVEMLWENQRGEKVIEGEALIPLPAEGIRQRDGQKPGNKQNGEGIK